MSSLEICWYLFSMLYIFILNTIYYFNSTKGFGRGNREKLLIDTPLGLGGCVGWNLYWLGEG